MCGQGRVDRRLFAYLTRARKTLRAPPASRRTSCERASTPETLDTCAFLAVFVKPSAVSTSIPRPLPTLTPLEHNSRAPARTPQMAPGGPARVMGRCEAACLHFPITPLAGNSHDDRKKVCGRDSNPPPYPLPAPFACTDPPTHTLAGLLLFSMGLLLIFLGPKSSSSSAGAGRCAWVGGRGGGRRCGDGGAGSCVRLS